MSNEEISERLHGLEHDLLELWEWFPLYRLGRSINSCSLDEDRNTLRELRHSMNIALLNSYTKALELIDSTLAEIERGPVTCVLIEQLRDRVLWWTGDGSFAELFTHASFDLGHENPDWQLSVGDEVITDPTAGDYKGNWSAVAQDLAFYGSKIADHLQGYLVPAASDKGNTALPSVRTRPKWNGNASELAFLLTELVESGHLVPPPIGKKTGKEGNRAAIATAFLTAFDIRKDNGDPVSPDYFKSLMKPDSPDRGTFTKLFTIRPRTESK